MKQRMVWAGCLLSFVLLGCQATAQSERRCATTSECSAGAVCALSVERGEGLWCVPEEEADVQVSVDTGGGTDTDNTVEDTSGGQDVGSSCGDCGAFACNERLGACETECGEDDRLCAAGFHCDAGDCFEDKAAALQCDEDSDCSSQTCTSGRCCEVAGQCCASDADCGDFFLSCSSDNTQTCLFVPVTVPPSGQTVCYVDDIVTNCGSATAYPGQDGSVGVGDKRFVELEAGVILDEDTQRVWAQASASADTHTDALTTCTSLDLAGKTGKWRLPKRFELQSLVDYGTDSGVLIDDTVFADTQVGKHWTSTEFAGDTNAVWVVSFQNGEVLRNAKLAPGMRLRCVMTKAEFDL